MKIIILFALFVLVSSKPPNQSPHDDELLQNIYDCSPGEKCADNINSTKDKVPDAIEKACPKCSPEQKKNMALFIDAINKGKSVEEAQKLYNPDNKYFDVVVNPDTDVAFDATVNAVVKYPS